MSIPSKFGRYRVIAHLATGGMAQIFVARLEGPARFQRTVAIKRVLPHLIQDQRFRSMFLDEARVSAAIHHPCVGEVIDLVEDDEVYLVMEYVAGETTLALMRALKKADEPMSWRVAAHVVAHAAAGLHAAHTLRIGSVVQPVIHRDVSPHNILIGYDGSVKVIDFGIAKLSDTEGLTKVGEVKGKFAYMAPEQLKQEPIDARTDVFSLGVVLWEFLTGKRLFLRGDQLSTMGAVLTDEVPRPDELASEVPPELSDLVMRCLSRELDGRPASADELRSALDAILGTAAPEAQKELVGLMKRLFHDRILVKEAVVHGEPGTERVPSLATEPPSELSVTTRVPAVHSEEATTGPKRNRARVGALMGVLSVAAVVLLGLLVRANDDASTKEPAATVNRPPVVASPAPPAATPGSEAAEAVEPARLLVRSTPEDAQVFLDGRFLGVTPLTWKEDGPIAGSLRLRLDGYEAEELTVDLEHGRAVTIDRDLEKEKEDRRARRQRTRRRGARRSRAEPDNKDPRPIDRPEKEQKSPYFRFD